MKTYEAIFDVNKKGVFAISLVNDPATEEFFIAMKKNQEIQFKTLDEEKRLLTGLVLRADQIIPRKHPETGEEFNILFRADTIRELSQNFFNLDFHKNSRLEHEDIIDGVTFVESWTVLDPKNDKSTALGLSSEKDDWFITMKVYNDEIWNDYVKTGKVKGFSIDALMPIKEINLNSNNMYDEILKAIKEGFTKLTLNKDKDEIKLAMVKSGDIEIHFEGDALEVGGAVWTMGEEDMKVALPPGDYPLDEGKVLVVTEEGIVAEVKAASDEGEELDKEGATDNKIADEISNAIKSVLIKYNKDVEEMIEAKLKPLQDENKRLSDELVELSKEPAGKKAGPKGVQQVAVVELTKQGRMLQVMRENQN